MGFPREFTEKVANCEQVPVGPKLSTYENSTVAAAFCFAAAASRKCSSKPGSSLACTTILRQDGWKDRSNVFQPRWCIVKVRK